LSEIYDIYFLVLIEFSIVGMLFIEIKMILSIGVKMLNILYIFYVTFFKNEFCNYI